jgi:hypothetical protein
MMKEMEGRRARFQLININTIKERRFAFDRVSVPVCKAEHLWGKGELFYASPIVFFLWVAARREGQQKMSLFSLHSV